MLNNQHLLHLEELAKAVRAAGPSTVVVHLSDLDELLRVYRLATSEDMQACLLHGEFIGPGELLNQLFPIGHGG